MLKIVNDQAHFDSLVSQWDIIIFKHSTRCSISNRWCQQVYTAVESLGLDNIYIVDVLTQKELSSYIATYTGIKHESPQIIFFRDGKAYAHGSHGQVNERNIKHILGWGWAGK
jgi:bacillithiol system protein YtxJ